MKKLLYISYIFPPMTAGGVFRNAQFTKYLPEFGWSPTVLTTSLPRRAQVDRHMLNELPKEVHIVRAISLERIVGYIRGAKFKGVEESAGIFFFVKRLVSMFFFPDRQLLWLPAAFWKGCRILLGNSYELIYVTYGPATNLLLGYLLKKIFRKPLVVDFRDLWADDPTDPAPTRLHQHLHQYLENKIVKSATRIITVVDYISKHYQRKYKLSDREVITITNGFDPEEQKSFRKMNYDNHKKFKIVYTGSVYGYRSPINFFQALKNLKIEKAIKQGDLEILFFGNLDKKVPQNYNLDKIVKISGYIPHIQVMESLTEADVLLLIIGKKNKHIAYTGKVFEYLMTGKPILALTAKDSIVASLLRKAGVGFIVDPDDMAEIKKTIFELYTKWKNRTLHASPKWSVINQFDRRKLTKKLAEIFAEVVEPPVKKEQC